jgi:2-iminobutanoate/2-iminopropanoate deaminase
MKEAVYTDQAHKGVGPYSQAVKANGFIFVSGQLALDPATGNLVAGGIKEQLEQVLKNLTTILEAAGSSWEKVVKATVFLKDMNNFAQMNEIYARALKGIPPVRSAVEVARLPKDALVEIDVISLA